jgi:hypothetical protein
VGTSTTVASRVVVEDELSGVPAGRQLPSLNCAWAVEVEMPAVRSGFAGMAPLCFVVAEAFVGGATCDASDSSGGRVCPSSTPPKLAALAVTRGEADCRVPDVGATSTDAAAKSPSGAGRLTPRTSTPSRPADVEPVALTGTGAAEEEVCVAARNDPGNARATATAAPLVNRLENR